MKFEIKAVPYKFKDLRNELSSEKGFVKGSDTFVPLSKEERAKMKPIVDLSDDTNSPMLVGIYADYSVVHLTINDEPFDCVWFDTDELIGYGVLEKKEAGTNRRRLFMLTKTGVSITNHTNDHEIYEEILDPSIVNLFSAAHVDCMVFLNDRGIPQKVTTQMAKIVGYREDV